MNMPDARSEGHYLMIGGYLLSPQFLCSKRTLVLNAVYQYYHLKFCPTESNHAFTRTCNLRVRIGSSSKHAIGILIIFVGESDWHVPSNPPFRMLRCGVTILAGADSQDARW
jgi:hypothetical protein